jgi:hypothetical protein
MNVKDVPPHTLITGAVAIAWLGSFVIRAVNPAFTMGAAADGLMVTCVTYWMRANAKGKQNGDGLVESLVNEVALPMISAANSPQDAQLPTLPGAPAPPAYTPQQPTQPYTPKPQQPYTPKPAQPKKGLPWTS